MYIERQRIDNIVYWFDDLFVYYNIYFCESISDWVIDNVICMIMFGKSVSESRLCV